MILFAVLLQTVIFQFYSQAVKRLREKGVSSLQILAYQRHAIYPSTVALVYFWNWDSFHYLLAHPHTVLVFLGFLISASIFGYMYFVSRHMTHSLTFVSAFLNAVGLPLLLVGGVLINHDTPTVYGIIGIILLVVATFLKPAKHDKEQTKGQFLYTVPVIIFISLCYLILQAIKDPLYRAFLMGTPNVWFGVTLYMVCLLLIINIFFLFKKLPAEQKLIEHTGQIEWNIIAIPTLWFLGSLPEGYSFANLPVYTLVAISMIGFLMSFTSDLYHHRIKLNAQTTLFALLVISGVVLNVIGKFVG